MMSSDSQAMGRIGEVIIRTWQTADKMKTQRGRAARATAGDDNRARQALRRQVHDQPGHRPRHGRRRGLDRGGQARRPRALEARVLRRQARAGASRAGSSRGRPWAIPTPRSPRPQPVLYRPMFGALRPRACGSTSLTFVSARGAGGRRAGRGSACGKRGAARCAAAAALGKRAMIHNDALPRIEVDPETYEVRADGELLTCEPAARAADGPALLPVLSGSRCVGASTESPARRWTPAALGRPRAGRSLRARRWEERRWTRKRVRDATAGASWRWRCRRAACCGRATCSHVEADWYVVVEARRSRCSRSSRATARRRCAWRSRWGTGTSRWPSTASVLLVPDDAAMEQLLTRLGVRVGAARRRSSIPLGRTAASRH